MEVRKEVKDFAEAMETKLRKKDPEFPNGWKNDNKFFLFNSMMDKVECLNELSWTDPRNPELLVDIANFAMMIHDIMKEESQ